jgi:DNA transformation protein
MSNTELLTYITQNITKFPITSRKMFGGIGVFSDKVMFALMYDGSLYLKSTPAIAKTYAADSTPFQPPFRRNMTMPYWRVPENILKDRHQFTEWAQQSLEYAKMTKKKK